MHCKLRTLTDLGQANGGEFRAKLHTAGLLLDLAAATKGSLGHGVVLPMTTLSLAIANLRVLANLTYARAAAHHAQVLKLDKVGREVSHLVGEFLFTFVTSSVSCLDMFSCCIKAITTRTIDKEEATESFAWLKKSKLSYQYTSAVVTALQAKPWIQHLRECRNRLVHRGYFPKITYRSLMETVDLSLASIREEFSKLDQTAQTSETHIDCTIARRDLSWTDQPVRMPDGAFRDGRGNLERPFDLDMLAEGFLVEFEQIDEAIARALCRDGLAPEVPSFQPISLTYHSQGLGLLVHRTIGSF